MSLIYLWSLALTFGIVLLVLVLMARFSHACSAVLELGFLGAGYDGIARKATDNEATRLGCDDGVGKITTFYFTPTGSKLKSCSCDDTTCWVARPFLGWYQILSKQTMSAK